MLSKNIEIALNIPTSPNWQYNAEPCNSIVNQMKNACICSN